MNLLSLFPTLCELAGLPTPDTCDGPSLAPLLANPTADWERDSVTFLSKPGNYSVSGATHRYIHYVDGSEELYDIETDPFEWTNLASKASAKALLERFRVASPKEFAERVEPTVESLVKLPWHPAAQGAAPASRPDGSPFPIYIQNDTKETVELFWMDRTGKPISYGLIQSKERRRQQTRPGAVWLIAQPKSRRAFGHFVVDDRTAQAIVPPTAKTAPR